MPSTAFGPLSLSCGEIQPQFYGKPFSRLLFVKTEFIEINFSRSVQSNYLASHMKSEVN